MWPSSGAVLSAPRRAGLAAAIRYQSEHSHLRVSADYEDAYGYRLGQFITGQRTAYQAGALDPAWIAELEDLGMIWDDHEATWQGHLATVEAFHAEHGHLAIPTQLPGGQFLADQRALARKDRLTLDRDNQLTALDPDWKLPYGPDWHRKYHLLRRHLEAGNHPSTLRRDTVIHGVKAGSWLHRQLTSWPDLDPGQRDLLARMGITPDRALLEQKHAAGRPSTSRRRTFAQTTEILGLFVARWGRTPGAREWIEVDGDRVMIGPWLAKVRTKLNNDQLPSEQEELVSATLAEHGIDLVRAPGTIGPSSG